MPELPTDIWKYCIFPCLDYNSRISLNKVLCHDLRVYKTWTKQDIEGHYGTIAARILNPYVEKIIRKINNCRDIFDLFVQILKPKFAVLLRNKNFRKAALEKAKMFQIEALLYNRKKFSLVKLMKTVVKRLERIDPDSDLILKIIEIN